MVWMLQRDTHFFREKVRVPIPTRDWEGDHAQHDGGGTEPLPILVVAEQNQGGRMVEAVLRIADPGLNVKPVTATSGKSDRATPVAMLFEAGKVLLHGRFPALEAELLGMIAGGVQRGHALFREKVRVPIPVSPFPDHGPPCSGSPMIT